MNKANILRHGLDENALDIRGMIRTKAGAELDCSGATSVEGIQIEGNQPNKTNRKIAFKIDGEWGRLESSGAAGTALFIPFVDQEITMDSVIDDGNTVSELQGYTNIPDFAGKKIGVAVALCAKFDAPGMPTLKLALKCRSVNDTFTQTLTSAVYDFGALSEIANAAAGKTESDGGTVTVSAKLVLEDGSETEWLPLNDIADKVARSVQYQAILSAEQIGASRAALHSVATEYTRGVGVISGHGQAEIISVTRNWNIPLRSIRMKVKHAHLKDSVVNAYVAFRDVPMTAAGEELGLGTGEAAVYQLSNITGIHQDSLRLFFDGVRQYAGYVFNAEVGRVTCAAPPGSVVSVNYDYGWMPEAWQEMRNLRTIPGVDRDATEYSYTLPTSETPKSICAVKIAMETRKGIAEGEGIGTGTGAVKSYMLRHTAKHGTMILYANGVQMPPSEWALSLDGRSIRVLAQKNAMLAADYEWYSETPQVYQFVAAFAE